MTGSKPNPHTDKIQIISIDGPAGAGKSTVARGLAKRLNISYLDTGAMYRALTLKALRLGISLEDENQLVAMAQKTTIDVEDLTDGMKVLLDGEDVSEDIRSLNVTNNTFYIARTPRIRKIMVQWQRIIGGKKSVVVEGRDVGTVVFPKASCKFYLDANFEERTKRRIEELKEQGKEFNEDKLTQELRERDLKDQTRSAGPLKKADDAIFIDSTNLSVDEVVEMMLHIIKENG